MAAIRYHEHGAHPQGTRPAPQTALSDLTALPYRYRGSDFTRPEPAAPMFPPRPARRRDKPLDDPEWLAADAPLCAPRDWLADREWRGDL